MKEDDLSGAAKLLFNAIYSHGALELPDSKDRLFGSESEFWQFNACISAHKTTHAYATGYLDAAKLLARLVIYSQKGVDTLVYPIVYLYRHYLEITLKDLIRKGCDITDSEISESLQKALDGHGLMRLWNGFAPFFAEVSGGNSSFPEVKRAMESYINQIHEIDPESVSFRYDSSKGTKDHKLENIQHINMLQLCNNMEKLTDLLEGVASEFSEALDYVNECRADMRDS